MRDIRDQSTKAEPRTRPQYDELHASIRRRSALVSVIGLGYVGLPLAVTFGECGLRCLGVDIDHQKRDSLNSGRSYIADVSNETIRLLMATGRLAITDDFTRLWEADAIVVCVPTPVHRDKRPDLAKVLRAGEEIGRILRPGQLVVLESTCYPGTTEDTLRPLLERVSGLKAGTDFWLAFSPERIDPGNQRFGLPNTPKVVGGIDEASTELAATLYSHIVPDVVRVSSPREAEMSKLIENVFRHVNIALANELAIASEHLSVDFWEALDAASSKPFGFMPFRPGPGVGGHCIPVDPHYLAWRAKEFDAPLRLIDAAEQINSSMPRLVVDRVTEEINRRGLSMRDARILLLGVSYKRGVGDMRESPSLRIMDLLESKGAVVMYHDPYVPRIQRNGRSMISVSINREIVSAQDCVVLVTDHNYDLGLLLSESSLLIDTRNAVKQNVPNCVRLWGRNGHNGHGNDLAAPAVAQLVEVGSER